MALFPVSIQARPYRGSKPELWAKFSHRKELAKRVERYINERMERNDAVHILYVEIADEFHLTKDKLRDDLVFPIDSGDNGLTVYKSELSM